MKAYISFDAAGVDEIHITLSRRNLLALLAKLDGHPPNSANTIGKEIDTTLILITAEEDAEHYAERAPGEMHPDTEKRLRQ